MRASPSVTANELGMLRKGTVVSVEAVQGDWVRLEKREDHETGAATNKSTSDPASYGGGWMLTDGKGIKNADPKAPKLGVLLKPHIITVRRLLGPQALALLAPSAGGGCLRPLHRVSSASVARGLAVASIDSRWPGAAQEAVGGQVAACGLWRR